jgi:hyperosmotically inducible protein
MSASEWKIKKTSVSLIMITIYQGGKIMQINIATICFMAGISLVPRMGFTADSKSDNPDPATIVQDSDITNKIKVRLSADKHFGRFKNIKVDTDNDGIVWLSGTAHLLSEEEKAIEIARGTKGVVIVKSNIKIKNGNPVSD